MLNYKKKMYLRVVSIMTDYQNLLDKYSHEYVHGEERSSGYRSKIRQESRLKNRLLLADQLFLELNSYLNKNQKDRVKYLVKIFDNDFKYLHRQASEETIILSFIMFIKKLESPKFELNNYSVCKKYNLTDTIFELIICRVLDYFMMNSDLYITESTRDNYEILLNGGFL